MSARLVLVLDAPTEEALRSTDPLPGICTFCGTTRARCWAWLRAIHNHPVPGSNIGWGRP